MMAIINRVISAIIFFVTHNNKRRLRTDTNPNKNNSIFNRIGYIKRESRKLMWLNCGSYFFNNFFSKIKQA